MINQGQDSKGGQRLKSPGNRGGFGNRQTLIWLLILFTLLTWLAPLLWGDGQVTAIDYSELLKPSLKMPTTGLR